MSSNSPIVGYEVKA